MTPNFEMGCQKTMLIACETMKDRDKCECTNPKEVPVEMTPHGALPGLRQLIPVDGILGVHDVEFSRKCERTRTAN
jgi:hypothetical protein